MGFFVTKLFFFFCLLLTNKWPAVSLWGALPWLHHPFHCILVTISLCGSLWSDSCSLPHLWLLFYPFPEELGRNFISHMALSLVTASVQAALEKCICSVLRSLHIITSSNFLFLFAVLCSFSLTLLTTHQFFSDILCYLCMLSCLLKLFPFHLPISLENFWRVLAKLLIAGEWWGF